MEQEDFGLTHGDDEVSQAELGLLFTPDQCGSLFAGGISFIRKVFGPDSLD